MRVPYQRLLNILILEWEEIKLILIEKIINNDVGFFKEMSERSVLRFMGVVFPNTAKNLDLRPKFISGSSVNIFLSKDYFVFESMNFSLVDREQLVDMVITHNLKTHSRTNLSDDIDENYEILSENFYNDNSVEEIRALNNIIQDFYLFCEKVRKS